MKSPGLGETGALRTEGGGVGSGDAFHPTLNLFTLTAALPLSPLHSVAADHRDPLAVPRRDRRRRSVLLQSARLQATDDLASAPKCEGNSAPEHLVSRHCPIRTYR